MVVAVPADTAPLARPWADAYPPGVPPTYRLPAVPLTRFLDDAARDFPDHPALVAGGETLTYAALHARVVAIAAVLAGAGVVGADRVVVAVPNDAVAPVVLFSSWRLGAVAVPLDPAEPMDRLAAAAVDADPKAVVGNGHTLAALRSAGVAADVWLEVGHAPWRPARAGARLVTRLRRARRGADGDPPIRRLVDGGPDRARARGGVAPVGATRAAAVADGSGADVRSPAVIAYAHGTNPPHGVVFTHGNLVAAAFQARLWVPDVQAGRERVLVPDRLAHPVGLSLGLLPAILAAATVVLADDPDTAGLARTIERERPTLCTTTTARLRDLHHDRDGSRRDLTSLRVLLACGEPLDPAVAVGLERRTGGARVRECFGVPEAGPLTHAQPVYGRVVPGSIGLPVTSTIATAVDPDDLDLPVAPGQPGRLLVAGPQVAGAYWRRPTLTRTRFVDGWVVTDELATVDVDGTFRHLGARAEVVEHRGRLVPLHTVEEILERHPAVRQAAVVPSPDGTLLVAAVVLRRWSHPDPPELVAHCAAASDSPAAPDHVIVVPSLPRTASGAVARDELSRDLATRLP